MDQAGRVRRGQALGRLPRDPHRRRRRQLRLTPEPICQRFALKQRHHEERHAAVLADLVDGDDMIVLDGGGRPRLAQESASAQLMARALRFHHLQSDSPAQGGILGLKDHAHAALAEQPQDAEAAQPADFVA